jgi:hypothetical protein
MRGLYSPGSWGGQEPLVSDEGPTSDSSIASDTNSSFLGSSISKKVYHAIRSNCVHGSPHYPLLRNSGPLSRALVLDPSRWHRTFARVSHWATCGPHRVKLLKFLTGRSDVMYHQVEHALGIGRRYVKTLVGELRALGLVETPGNPATIVLSSKLFKPLVSGVLTAVDPKWVEAVMGGSRGGSPPEGGGTPPPLGTDSGESAPRGRRGPPPPARR